MMKKSAENGGGETAALRARVGSLHFPLSEVRLTLHISHICL